MLQHLKLGRLRDECLFLKISSAKILGGGGGGGGGDTNPSGATLY